MSGDNPHKLLCGENRQSVSVPWSSLQYQYDFTDLGDRDTLGLSKLSPYPFGRRSWQWVHFDPLPGFRAPEFLQGPISATDLGLSGASILAWSRGNSWTRSAFWLWADTSLRGTGFYAGGSLVWYEYLAVDPNRRCSDLSVLKWICRRPAPQLPRELGRNQHTSQGRSLSGIVLVPLVSPLPGSGQAAKGDYRDHGRRTFCSGGKSNCRRPGAASDPASV